MTIFDLLFLVLALLSIGTFVFILIALLRRRGAYALALLRRWSICALIYLAIVGGVGFFTPQRVLGPGDPWCFDDWCMRVESVRHAPAPPQVAYTVNLRLFSRALRVDQRASGAWIYLVDQQGRRYPPVPDPSATPLDVLLASGQSVNTTRTFLVPPNAAGLRLITGHGGPFNPGLVVIGDDDSLFHQRTFVRLQ